MMKKFKEDLNTAVITTRFVFGEGKPVTCVFHHEEDGMWEFIGDDFCGGDEDYFVVSLEEMIRLHPSILDIADLPLGMKAYRDGSDGGWTVCKREGEL